MRTLLLIPSVLKRDIAEEVRADRHPRMDYHALADGLGAAGADVQFLDYDTVERHRGLLVRLTRRLLGRDAALAFLGFLQRRRCDVFFTNGENIAIPLALLLKLSRDRPGHVTIGHRVSTRKKACFFRVLRVQNQIDTCFVYSSSQFEHAVHRLSIPPERLSLIQFHADDHFYRPPQEQSITPNQVCSAGLEWRDYPTLIDSIRELPHLQLRLAAASPWSKHKDETANRQLPGNVDACRYSYLELRELYATSSFVVVPLYETDFQAGVTTLLEAMAMGKAVIVTRTAGQTDVVVDGENGLCVAPGDVAGWRRAIEHLHRDPQLRARLGSNARRWVEEHATLDQWVAHLVSALSVAARRVPVEREPWTAVTQSHSRGPAPPPRGR